MHYCLASGVNFAQKGTHLRPALYIQRRYRLIQQQASRLTRHRPRQANTLRFSAGQRPGIPLEKSGNCEIFGKLTYTFADFRILNFSAPKRICNIIINRYMREKCAVLENQADFSLLHLFVGNVFSVEKYPAGIRMVQAGYGLKQYAFAHAGCAK